MRRKKRYVARGLGLGSGVAFAAVTLLGWRVPTGDGPLWASVEFATHPIGELHVSTDETFLAATDLEAGGRPASGSVTVTNLTMWQVSVQATGVVDVPDLNSILQVRVSVEDDVLYEGP